MTPERFSLAWRYAIDDDYRHGKITEERWRDLIAAFELACHLSEIENGSAHLRVRTATPSSWKIGFGDGSGLGEYGEGFYITNAEDETVVMGGKDDWGVAHGVLSYEDAVRIAHVPDLEAEVERLRAERDDARQLAIAYRFGDMARWKLDEAADECVWIRHTVSARRRARMSMKERGA